MFCVKVERPTPENSALIDCGHGHFAIVDKKYRADLHGVKWHTRKSYRKIYAVKWVGTAGSRKLLYMHRVVAGTGPDEVGHHCNRNTLDNRSCNILNCIDEVHRDFHRVRRWIRNFKRKTSKTRVVPMD